MIVYLAYLLTYINHIYLIINEDIYIY